MQETWYLDTNTGEVYPPDGRLLENKQLTTLLPDDAESEIDVLAFNSCQGAINYSFEVLGFVVILDVL